MVNAGLADCGAVRVDEGCMALRSRPAEGGFKPPTTALAEDRCGERRGKSRDWIPAGVSRGDERWSQSGLCRPKRRNCVRRHQNQGVGCVLGSVWGISAYCPDGVRRTGSMNPASGSRTEHVNACRETVHRGTGGKREHPERQNPQGTEYRRAARGRTLPSS